MLYQYVLGKSIVFVTFHDKKINEWKKLKETVNSTSIHTVVSLVNSVMYMPEGAGTRNLYFPKLQTFK